jgi:hypothetical protein
MMLVNLAQIMDNGMAIVGSCRHLFVDSESRSPRLPTALTGHENVERKAAVQSYDDFAQRPVVGDKAA